MGFFKRFFGGKSESSEDKKEDQSAKNFEVLKYDGVRAMHQGQMDYAIKCLTNALLAKQVDEEGDASKEDQDRLWRFVACAKRRENLWTKLSFQ